MSQAPTPDPYADAPFYLKRPALTAVLLTFGVLGVFLGAIYNAATGHHEGGAAHGAAAHGSAAPHGSAAAPAHAATGGAAATAAPVH